VTTNTCYWGSGDITSFWLMLFIQHISADIFWKFPITKRLSVRSLYLIQSECYRFIQNNATRIFFIFTLFFNRILQIYQLKFVLLKRNKKKKNNWKTSQIDKISILDKPNLVIIPFMLARCCLFYIVIQIRSI